MKTKLIHPETTLINKSKFPLNAKTEWSFTFQENQWAKSLLEELQEALVDGDEETIQLMNDPSSSLIFQGDLEKKESAQYGIFFLATLRASGLFYRPCDRCLIPTMQTISFEENICFLEESMAKALHLDEGDQIFIKQDDIRDVYFFEAEKGPVLKDALRENVFIFLPDFALHIPDCKGLCFECGTNLNEKSCDHQK